MPERLPPREGEWIDRSQTIEFSFEGKPYRGYAGDVLSSALWANGQRVLGRSFKYHRPRGIFSLANCDVNLLVEGGGHTNLRGDVLAIKPGMQVCAVNTWGGLRRDRYRVTERFSKLLPVGFYYKAFHSPRWLFPFYERQMRKVAGLGRVSTEYRSEPSPKDYEFCDLLVVGGGPAGLAAAVAGAEQGLEVLLVDEQPHLGGSFQWQRTDRRDLYRTLDERVRSLPNLRVRLSTLAAGAYADHWIALVDEQRLSKTRARAMIVAAGCFEQPAVFHNNDLPGVMLGSAAQRLIHQFAVKPCGRAVVLAANRDGYRVAFDLLEAGVEVLAVLDMRRETDDPEVQLLQERGVAIHWGHGVYEAIPNRDRTGLARAIACELDESGKPRNAQRLRFDCDGLVISVGWMPNIGLAFQSGARFTYSEPLEQLVPKSLPPTVMIAGRANGVYDLAAQVDDGRRAGLEAARELGKYQGTLPAVPSESTAPSHPYPIVRHEQGKCFVDLDEDLHLEDLVNAHQEGYDNIELLKRYTTVGMGPSQGKLSNMNAVRILARLNRTRIDETGTTTSRPFHHPVPIRHLAGRRFHPMQQTPLHDWHVAQGGMMIQAGTWYRPEYYQVPGITRDDCILRESRQVRESLGLIDVGTLGKILVAGPDAGRFLEYVYTGRFQKQPVGRIRYGLACDESGVIIEDGVVARTADDQYYLTATSSGVAAMYREMQRWALLTGMQVTLANLTGQLAAMNLAGPQARTAFQQVTDLDLSSDAFPYLSVRQGTVAGVRATVMRVGFVGELGYEVHVSFGDALHAWVTLMQAGAAYGIRPFGIESQRLLRLEKGHLIVGQDTDALTTPYEANMEWAIGRGKSAFVGSRSLEWIARQPQSRELVGVVFQDSDPGQLPEECHLLIEDGEIAGRITSIAKRSTLGYPIALAYVRPHLAENGRKVAFRLSNRSLVEGVITTIPFYDPNHERQA